MRVLRLAGVLAGVAAGVTVIFFAFVLLHKVFAS